MNHEQLKFFHKTPFHQDPTQPPKFNTDDVEMQEEKSKTPVKEEKKDISCENNPGIIKSVVKKPDFHVEKTPKKDKSPNLDPRFKKIVANEWNDKFQLISISTP